MAVETMTGRVLGSLAALGLTWMVFELVRRVVMLPGQGLVLAATGVLLGGAAVALVALFTRRAGAGGAAIPLLLLVVALILTVPFAFMLDAFGTRDVGSLLITLRENRTDDMLAVGLEGFLPLIGVYAAGIVLALSCAGIVVRRRAGRWAVALVALLLIGTGPLSHYLYRGVVPSPAHALIDPDTVTGPPAIVARPEVPKNLVIVYLESLERSYRDVPEAAQAFAPLAALEDRGLAFSDIGQVHGTHFTMGGIVASQCGVPLLPRGLQDIRTQDPDRAALASELDAVLPGLICLGDVLKAEGYATGYLNGSDLRIFSKGPFFRTHGYDDVRGLSDYPGWETEPRRNVWGMDDDLLFERLTARLRMLAAGDAPFLLAGLTLATHGPGGYPDSACPVGEGPAAKLRAAIECTGGHVMRLLNEIDALGLGPDTLVLVVSDHLAFRNDLGAALRATERRNYAVVLGAGQGRVMRAGTMLDLYPTLLELMGYRLENGRAGLGQSLISDAPTFAETHGTDTLDAAIRYNTALQEALWR